MIVRILVVTAAVLAAPAAAFASPGTKAAGTTTVSNGSVSRTEKAEAGKCAHGKSTQGEAGECSHEKAVTAGTTPEAPHGAHGMHGAHGAVLAKVTVAELAAKLAAKPAAVAVDANNEQTRAKEGMIPGAKLLTSASHYDPAKELGMAKDAELVFYCANTRCTASHTAAMRAIEAGYTHVSILPEGIAGWKAAGKATAAVPRS